MFRKFDACTCTCTKTSRCVRFEPSQDPHTFGSCPRNLNPELGYECFERTVLARMSYNERASRSQVYTFLITATDGETKWFAQQSGTCPAEAVNRVQSELVKAEIKQRQRHKSKLQSPGFKVLYSEVLYSEPMCK